jgi:hypothetical protein
MSIGGKFRPPVRHSLQRGPALQTNRLQPKMSGVGRRQQPFAISQVKKPPIAPSVYQPQPVPRVLQTKMTNPQPLPKVLQPKKVSVPQKAAPPHSHIAAHPVHRPEIASKALQQKTARGKAQTSSGINRTPPILPPAYQRQPPSRLVQAKTSAMPGRPRPIVAGKSSSSTIQRMTMKEANDLIQKRWGIRSASAPDDLGGAAFAVMPTDDPMDLFTAQAGQGILSTTSFLNLIRSTCQWIKDYRESGNNYLLIIKVPRLSIAEGYENTLKKHNSAASSTIAKVTPAPLSSYTVDELYNFVVANIPDVSNLTPDG